MRQAQQKTCGRNELTAEMNKDLYETASQSVLRLTLRTQMIG